MEFLNRAAAQAAELFKSMTPAARLIAAMLVVVIAVSVAYLFRIESGTGDEYLFGGQQFNQRELGIMDLAFSKAGLKGGRIDGLRMLIPRGQKDVYLKAIQENDAMPETMTRFTDQAIGKDNSWSSREQRSHLMKNAKERELSRIIREIRGYEEATVQYDESEAGGLHRTRERTALVAVRAQGNRPLGDDEIRAIREAVRGGLMGLKPSNISVLDLNTGDTHTGAEPGHGNGSENAYLATKRMYERVYKSKIVERLMPMYPGIWVGVNVELDPELYQSTTSTELKGKPVTVARTTVEKDTPVLSNANGGRPGSYPNAIGNQAQQVAANAPGPAERATESRVQETLLNSQQQVESQKAGLVPTQVRASIDVPMKYLVQVYRESNPKADKDTEPPDDELRKLETEARKRIESAVSGVLPTTVASDGKPLVTIGFVPDLPEVPLAKPSVAETATSWLAGNWQTIGMFLLGLIGMWFLRGMVRSVPEPAQAAAAETASATSGGSAAAESGEAPALRVVGGSDGERAEGKEARQRRRFRGQSANLREELAELVKEDPDMAANILRNWIGDVA